MKQFLCTLLLLFAVVLPAVSQDSFVSYDGQTFKTGDVLLLGNHYISSSKYITIKEGFTNKYGKMEYNNMDEGELPFSQVTIKEIIHPTSTEVFYNKEVIFLVESSKFPEKKLYIEINKSIERGEVISRLADKKLFENSIELTLEQMFACCVRVNNLPVDDNVVLNYISTIDKGLGRECMSDKFKFEKIKAEYKSRLEKSMADFDFTQTYFIKVNNYHGDYNFDQKGYPINFISSQETSVTKNFIPCNGFNFMITNIDKAKFLPVPIDAAEAYEKRNKGTGKNGYVSPLIYSIVYLTLLDQKMTIPKDKYQIINVEKLYRSTLIGADFKGMEVFDFPNWRYNFIGTVE